VVDSLFLVPASVELTALDARRSRLVVVWTNGLRGKWDGPHVTLRACQTELLLAISEQRAVDVTQWPSLRVGSGFEFDW
jgi:hypothetical protein